jgi:hypothetical protein
MVLAALCCGCKGEDETTEKQPPVDVAAERKSLIERLNASYGDKGEARLEGEKLVVVSAQCRDPKTSAAVVDFARKAAQKARITDVRCEAPPGPSKQDVVSRFNDEFASIGAKAEIAGKRGRALHLTTDECEQAEKALALLESAANLSREAGFEIVRCGKSGGQMFELDLRARVKGD